MSQDQSLYSPYERTPDRARWQWFCDVLTPIHQEVFHRAAAVVEQSPGLQHRPLRLEFAATLTPSDSKLSTP